MFGTRHISLRGDCRLQGLSTGFFTSMTNHAAPSSTGEPGFVRGGADRRPQPPSSKHHLPACARRLPSKFCSFGGTRGSPRGAASLGKWRRACFLRCRDGGRRRPGWEVRRAGALTLTGLVSMAAVLPRAQTAMCSSRRNAPIAWTKYSVPASPGSVGGEE